MAADNNPEIQVLHEFSSLIQDATIEPLSLATKLYSKDIIDRRVYMNSTDHSSRVTTYERSMELVRGIEAKLLSARTSEERAAIFDKVIEIFSDQIPLDTVAERMVTEYEEVKRTWVEPESEELILHTKTPISGLRDVLNALQPISDQWYNLGIQLNIPSHKLKSIKATKENVNEQLIEMLDIWLNDTNGTWEDIVMAAASPFVERRAQAEKIKRQFIDKKQ